MLITTIRVCSVSWNRSNISKNTNGRKKCVERNSHDIEVDVLLCISPWDDLETSGEERCARHVFILKSSGCQLQKHVIKDEGLLLKIVTLTSRKISRSPKSQIHKSIICFSACRVIFSLKPSFFSIVRNFFDYTSTLKLQIWYNINYKFSNPNLRCSYIAVTKNEYSSFHITRIRWFCKIIF